MSAAPPVRRRPPSRRRALALLVATALGLGGLAVLVVGWVGVGTSTLQASAAGTEPCLAGYGDGSDVRVRYELLPARAVCAWEVDGTRQEVVVAAVPTTVTATGLVLAVAGVAATVVLLVDARRAGRTAAAGRAGPDVPSPPVGTP